jgi:WD40 repeat protein
VSWEWLQRLSSGEEEEVTPFTLVRRSDTEEWQRAGCVKGLLLLPKARLTENHRKGRPQNWKYLLKGKLRGHRGMINTVKFSPRPNVLASGGFDNRIIIWDLNTCSPLNVLRGHGDFINCVEFSPSGDELASASFDGTIRLWDIWSGQLKAVLRGHDGSVRTVAYHPSRAILASAGNDGAIRQWDLGTQQETRCFPQCGRIEWIAFTNDGASILAAIQAGLRGGLAIYDAETGQGRPLCNAAFCHASGIARHSRIVALPCGGFNGAILLYWLDSEEERFWRAHESVVTEVAFSPDGKFLVSGSYDGLVKLWDIDLWSEMPPLLEAATLPGHRGQVRSVAFSHDGRTVASAGADSRVLLWDVGPFVDFGGEADG